MTTQMENFGLCVIITRPKLSYVEVAKACVKCGVSYLQLREKELSDRDILAAAEQIMAVTRGTQTKFVINDRADLAMLAKADMLHLGQDDISMDDARKIVGEDMPIGLSTHSLEQARTAIAQQPAYIGFGPIYPTTTKAKADPTVGVELLRELLAELGDGALPVIAIGGIFPENSQIVVGAGARNICLVRHLMECDTVEELERRITKLQADINSAATR